MILRSELIAALTAIGIEVEVQISLDGIPLDIDGLGLDERRGVIFLRPHPEHVPQALRRFVAEVTCRDGGEWPGGRGAYGHDDR
ncbi:hypothetical protein [Actinoplanes sp. NBRC 101535]|uniref:hypothetical protein n=1 Tax=Actinoplanes sp. NBRC 101535 TaxID=3032196 RepID=UPI0025574F77|nr:hypothetical protein [Actinoplanes sp. NBRC 101535]